ncbi:MAG: hypothetical protein ACRCXC_04650 [Legionella sp.]
MTKNKNTFNKEHAEELTKKGKEYESVEKEEHPNARTSHAHLEKSSKKKDSFFGDRGSRQSVRDEMVKDAFDLMYSEPEDELDNEGLDHAITSTRFKL